MKYYLVGDDFKRLFLEDENTGRAIFYHLGDNKWYEGTFILWKNRVGFDESEPIDSPYRFGNLSYMEDIVEITESEAEQFLGRKIVEKEISESFRRIKRSKVLLK